MNAFNSEGMSAPFTDDGLVNDIQREFSGSDPIRRWADKESVGDHVVTTDFTEVKEHHGSWFIQLPLTASTTRRGCLTL